MEELAGGVKRILVVEDEPVICQICHRVLTGYGFEVDIAVDSNVAQDMLRGKDYDLCLVDIRTPVMNGRQLYQAIIDRYPKLVSGVIFTTGNMADEYTQRFLKLARRPFLAKPFTPDELLTIVRETLGELEA